ncbi:hypothetical protein [Streptomyces sp. NPDC056361]|uniref:hypothetical protein n=1 Tax=Streptomyces sp. NPDC056361 TaxID=3345795 RepID=UPI0035D572AE
MEQRVRIHKVRVGDGEIRVIRPDPVPERLVLRDDGHWLSMYVDRGGAERLAALWALAARSARSLVHLPLRANRAPADAVGGDGVPVTLDLVLAHHGLQFPTASWKDVRARLGTGRPHTAATPDGDFPDPGAVDHARRYHRAYRDHLGFDIAAHTLFVVGSATAFREHGTELRAFVDEASSHGDRYPGAGHSCVEFTSGPWSRPRTRRHVPGSLHIQYCDTWRD